MPKRPKPGERLSICSPKPLQKPESATPEEAKLLSSMFGRKFENARAEEAAGKGSPSADDFFERKQGS